MTVQDVRGPSFPPFSHSWLTVLQALEREGEATLMATDTRHLLNAFNAAVQLPSDILVMIPLFLPAGGGRFTASQICRRWRAILVSSPLLWRHIDCRDPTQTVVSLERRGSVPLLLELDSYLSTDALDIALGHGSKIASVSARLSLDQIQSVYPRLTAPSLEELVLSVDEDRGASWGHNIIVDIQGEFRSMRKLSISGFFVLIDRITAPNLIHLSLENTTSTPRITVPFVLNMLRGCLQLETVLISILSDRRRTRAGPHSYNPVTLQKLHSIELGCTEAQAGLVIPLLFPPGVAVGFRGIPANEETCPRESIQHVLATVDIKSVTLAYIQHEDIGDDTYLIRFEGPVGSLEIFTLGGDRDPFGRDGPLLSHSPRLENVKTLHIMGCYISNKTFAIIASAMCNLVSINFIGRNVHAGSLIPTDSSPALFPHLENVAGLPARELARIARARKKHGMSLKSLSGHDDSRRTAKYLEDLGKLAEDVRICQCTDLTERWTSNALPDAWDAAGDRVPVSTERCQGNESWMY